MLVYGTQVCFEGKKKPLVLSSYVLEQKATIFKSVILFADCKDYKEYLYLLNGILHSHSISPS